MEIKLFDKTYKSIEKLMDLTFKRQAVLASNVANAETPNYKARELNFGKELEKAIGSHQNAMRKTNPLHMDLSASQGSSHIVFDNSMPVGNDGNNVDLDVTMGKVSANMGRYNNAINLMQMKMRILRMASQGRGGV